MFGLFNNNLASHAIQAPQAPQMPQMPSGWNDHMQGVLDNIQSRLSGMQPPAQSGMFNRIGGTFTPQPFSNMPQHNGQLMNGNYKMPDSPFNNAHNIPSFYR